MVISYTFLETGIACLEVNRPGVRNALNWDTMEQFAAHIERAHQDPDLRTLIITGRGSSFIAGGDLKVLHKHSQQADGERLSSIMTQALHRLETLPCPVIAAINGPARGGGAEIALACDLRVIETNADLGFVQITLGLTPGWGAGQRLLRLVGYSQALELLVTGRVLSAVDAHRLGLVNRVVSQSLSLSAALEIARQITAQPPAAVKAIKCLLQFGLNNPPAEAAVYEQAQFGPLWAAPAHLEAVEQYLKNKTSR
jgi:enoyl-CoA hydratase/carnithine racemase